MTEGSIKGLGINAVIIMPGGDRMNVSPDGFNKPNVRVQLETDDKAVISYLTPALLKTMNLSKKLPRKGKKRNGPISTCEWSCSLKQARKIFLVMQIFFIAEGRLINTNELSTAYTG